MRFPKFIVIIFFFFLNCHKPYSAQQLIDKFYYNKADLNALVNSVQNNKLLDSLFAIGPDNGLPDIKNIYPNEYALLKKIGITDASSFLGLCRKCKSWYYLKTDWPSEYPVYLMYNEILYDSTDNLKGFYKRDEYNNETWGLGDNWKMFRLVHTIDNSKQ